MDSNTDRTSAATSARRERISPFDGLTRSERARLYDPGAYTVQRAPGKTLTFLVRHQSVPAEFRVTVAYGRFWYCTSNTGKEYNLSGGCCHCQDAENRAKEENRPCKHAAACIAVSRFLRAEKAQQAAPASDPSSYPVGVPVPVGHCSDGGRITLTRMR